MKNLFHNQRAIFPTARDTLELTKETQTSVNDLNQPLMSLMTIFARFKKTEELSPRGREMITAMETEIERMGQITRKLCRLTEDTTRRRTLDLPGDVR